MSYQNLDGKVRVRAGLSTTYSVLAIAIASATSMSAVAAPAKKEQTTAMETVVVTGSVIGNSEIEDVKEYQVLVPSLPVIKLRKLQLVRSIMRYSVFRVLKFRMKAERAYCLTFPYVV